MIKLIVACDLERGIGYRGRIPWTIPEEMRWLSRLTRSTKDPAKRNALIMGRNTYLSIPPQRRPLFDRVNVVISSRNMTEKGALCVTSLAEAVLLARADSSIESGFIFGGERVYRAALDENMVEEAFVNVIEASFPADTFFPELPPSFKKVCEQRIVYGSYAVRHEVYQRF